MSSPLKMEDFIFWVQHGLLPDIRFFSLSIWEQKWSGIQVTDSYKRQLDSEHILLPCASGEEKCSFLCGFVES